jgi:membrane protein implicated in regulation of membrane protease activity
LTAELFFIGALLALLVAQRWDHGRQSKAERAHSAQQLSGTLAQVRELTDQIVLLKVEPQQAAALSYPEPPEDQPAIPVDDSPYADQAWAEYLERSSP